ncbi:hypothetical protein ACGFIK_27095 [Micromonospora sp. NPDC048871]|uniref:hypothetical protein n=1 Tax=Micromonospora sp. NPDC048871 TaxID=3364259 RepID=UPI0037135C7F
MSELPASGDVIRVTRAASVQFIRPMTFKVIKVLTELHTYDGWVWLRGYQLDDKGNAVASREIFVQPAGLVIFQKHRPQRAATANIQRGRNMSPAVRRSTVGVPNSNGLGRSK